MTISTELESLNKTKTAIGEALIEKGMDLSNKIFSDTPDLIKNMKNEGGDLVEVIALGKSDFETGDKVLLNPAISLQKETLIEYTPVYNRGWQDIKMYYYTPIGCVSAYSGKLYASGGSSVELTYDLELKKYMGETSFSLTSYPLIWGNPQQLYYLIAGTGAGSVIFGRFNSQTFSYQEEISYTTTSRYQSFDLLDNYFYDTYRGNFGYIQNGAMTILCAVGIDGNPNSLIRLNKEHALIYASQSYGYDFDQMRIASDPQTARSVSGFGFLQSTDRRLNMVRSLDEEGNYFIAGPYGSPFGAKIFRKAEESTAEDLIVEEVYDLSNQLPRSTFSVDQYCCQVDPITATKKFADIFIRYGIGELYYLQWDGKDLINYGKIGGDNVYFFSFNPLDRILVTNKAKENDPSCIPDFHVFSFQNVMNKEFVATDMASANWTQDTLTGFVKENKGQDAFGNNILDVITVRDPNKISWTEQGKMYGFNMVIEKGSL